MSTCKETRGEAAAGRPPAREHGNMAFARLRTAVGRRGGWRWATEGAGARRSSQGPERGWDSGWGLRGEHPQPRSVLPGFLAALLPCLTVHTSVEDSPEKTRRTADREEPE